MDDKRRLRIPDAKPGQLLMVQGSPETGWTVTPVPEDAKVQGLKPLTKEEWRRAYEKPDPEFDPLASHCAKLAQLRPPPKDED